MIKFLIHILLSKYLNHTKIIYYVRFTPNVQYTRFGYTAPIPPKNFALYSLTKLSCFTAGFIPE
ncbi:MAG: hypothetical protein EA361_13950 [Bacteroidetes bacterium]|nr:MAG: hypothetical protein EA361_13950 [Bacteroidota bacterium]